MNPSGVTWRAASHVRGTSVDAGAEAGSMALDYDKEGSAGGARWGDIRASGNGERHEGDQKRGFKQSHQSGTTAFFLSLILAIILILCLVLAPHTGENGGGSASQIAAPDQSLRMFEMPSPPELPPLPRIDVTDKMLHSILEGADEQYKENVAERSRVKTAAIFPNHYVTIKELKADYFVPTYPCPMEARMGDWGKWGRWVCLWHHNMNRPPLVVSVGSHGDDSFEHDVGSRMEAFSHTFDYTLNSTQEDQLKSHHFLKFYPTGIAGSKQLNFYQKRFPNATFITIKQMLRQAGTNFVDIFKMDCDGCEHEVVQDMGRLYSRKTVPFGQVLIDMHWLINSLVQLQTLKIMEDLGYRMFHSEVDAYWDGGFKVSYIHERLVDPSF